jgi:hypothetical protein
MPPLQVEIPAGAEVDLGDITLQPGVDLEFAFDGFDGKGGVRVFWLDAPARSGWRTVAGYHSAENGSVQKASLFPGRYGLVARSRNGVALLEIDTAALPPQPIRFDLRPGASLRLDNRVGTGFVRLEIATLRGMPVYRGEMGSRGFGLVLPPGGYVATITDAAGAVTQRSIALTRDGAVLTIPAR